jgi:cell division protein FtsL
MNQRERNKQADLELLRQFVTLIPKVLFVGFVVVLVVLEIIIIFKSF